ncbi:MAG: 30S ribosomal protein S12 methylthiotransferase RimO [Polyangiaceae bacterium]|nr:30S ribosomal protein S12 methylthiotransferase RimO [Polyangiaceae bacterium]
MTEKTPTVHFVSLGCPKNRVDSEVMLGVAKAEGYTHVTKPEEAEVIVVNTCGFIESAKAESINTILELSAHKQGGQCKKLVMAGCLSQRYPQELADDMPEVDHFLGSSDMLKLGSVLRGNADRMLVGNPADWVVKATDPRTISTRGASAYVKIAEGCNRSCSFCVIPQLRGKQRSRTPDDVIREVEKLSAAGVLEINLVSQDTVAYGRDQGGDRHALANLVERVANVPGIRWVRVFYLYPEKLDEHIIDVIANHERVVPYVDMPLQHAADAMLRRMGRGHGGDRLRTLVDRLRTKITDLVFRTAFIVGHPGETDEEFTELCDFVEWAEFDRVGVFHYSDEETCQSRHLDGKVAPELAQERAATLMELQQDISAEKHEALIGKKLEILVEGVSEESELVMRGRHAGQAPDIDGCVYLSGGPVSPGTMVHATISDATDYDLLGEVEDTLDPLPPPEVFSDHLVHRHSDGRRISLKTVS